MSMLEWTEENLPQLGKLFLLSVEQNMRHDDTKVRFGLTGTGARPNYEVEFPNGRRLAYGGLSHEQDTRADTFHEKRISQAFSRQQISDAIKKVPSATDRR